MEAQFGWTQISRAAVQRAEAQLDDETKGVLDELGLLEIHQGYADRFFPGTSVLHTRLRYVLFVAWSYEDMLRHRTPLKNAEAEIAQQERKVGVALKHNTDSWGLIGKRTLPRMPSQRPSMMYWSALGTWGLLHKHPDGTLPSRAEIHAHLSGRSIAHELHDDEKRPLQRNSSPFITLPPRPVGWPGGSQIDFRLGKDEQVFLRELLGSVHVPQSNNLSLLARLANNRAGNRLKEEDGLLCSEVRKVAGKDWSVLTRADQTASLAAVVRGVYQAMVEELACRDGLGDRNRCSENLHGVIAEHRDKALKLDMHLLRQDLNIGEQTRGICHLMEQTQQWLDAYRPGSLQLATLHNLYMSQERSRKKARARLAPTAKMLRKEWWLDKAREQEPMPAPLHYRWHIARSLLRDLENKGDRHQ